MTDPASDTMITPRLLTTLFTSLSRDSRRWTLTRILQSDNPMDIKGEIRGTATFTPQRQSPSTDPALGDMVYREEGEMPNTVGMGMAGLRWTKKYLWRYSENGSISVWFVKVGSAKKDEDEADYLFHEFDFGLGKSAEDGAQKAKEDSTNDACQLVIPPTPPLLKNSERETTVLMARGNHLCINDMYRTAYAFRIDPATGDVLSWSSRHMVKGPKKNQNIANFYELEG